MRKTIVRAFATCMMASLLTFPTYAQTTGTNNVEHIDIVSMTIKQITNEVKKAEALAKAEKKAAKEKALKAKKEITEVIEVAAETEAEIQQETIAVASENAEETEGYVQETEGYTADTESYAQETEAYAEETQSYAQETEAYVEETQSYAQETEAYVEETQTREYASSSSYDGEKLNSVNGMVEGPSGTETYYNLDMSGVISNMQDMGIDGDYWVRDDGVKMYGDYVMVAANLDTHPYGSVVESSLGDAIVVDTGDFAENDADQLDIAVEW